MVVFYRFKLIVMSNQSKRAEARKKQSLYERMFNRYDQKIMRRLQAYVASGHPFDKKQQMAYFSGALYGADRPRPRAKIVWFLIGSGTTLFIECLMLIYKLIVG